MCRHVPAAHTMSVRADRVRVATCGEATENQLPVAAMPRPAATLIAIRRLRRIQKGVETAFSLPRMVVPPNIQERGKRRGILCSKTPGQNHRDSVLL